MAANGTMKPTDVKLVGVDQVLAEAKSFVVKNTKT
jgi:hypothetical protein